MGSGAWLGFGGRPASIGGWAPAGPLWLSRPSGAASGVVLRLKTAHRSGAARDAAAENPGFPLGLYVEDGVMF